MARARGINAILSAAFETTYGISPVSGFKKLPFVSSNMGEERPLIEDDQLGFGRDGLDPTYDVGNNDGDVVVPIDTKAFGWWLKLLLGAPTTTADDDLFQHVFRSGAATLPSASLEIGMPDRPSYFMNYGARANQLRFSMQRSGMLNATLGLIAQGEADPVTATAAGTPTALTGTRFQQATGAVKKDGVQLAGVTGADFTFSNGMEKVETIRSDGRIEDVDPVKAMTTGSVNVRFADHALLDAATDGTPIELSFGWTAGDMSLLFEMPRVFLPRVKRPLSGPGGVQATFNFQASGAGGDQLIVTLVNDAAAY